MLSQWPIDYADMSVPVKHVCLVAVSLAFGAAVFAAEPATTETVLLRGGAEIKAPILRQDDRAVVLDIGHSLIRIPLTEVVHIRPDTIADAAAPLPDSASRHYSASERTAVLTTTEAVNRNAPAVVLIRTPRGLGSGFFVNRNGLLVTNFHVIAGSRRIAVTRFLRGDKGFRPLVHHDVDIVATAPFYDLAVLRIKAPKTPIEPVVFPAADDTKAGERIFVIGNPMGLEQTVTEGVVSQAHRNYQGVLWRQIDAPVNPGNSGGPLFNGSGQVIGVINAKVPFMDGLGFAIPAVHVKYLLDHLDAFAFNEANPESGFVYPDPPPAPRVNRAQETE